MPCGFIFLAANQQLPHRLQDFSVDIIIAWATNTGIKLLIAQILLFVSFKLIGRAAKLITKQCGGAWHFVSSAPDPTREYKKQTGMLLPIKK